MRGSPRALLVAVLVLAMVMAGASSTVLAHSLLERSEPPAYRLLLTPPREIVLRFSEPVDVGRTEVRVLDQEGRRVDRQAFRFSADRREARLPVRLPGPGIYTVTWRTLSTIDQHTYEGFFTFTLGPLRLGSFTLQGGLARGPSPWEVAARWLMFLAAAVLVGGLAIHRVLLPAALERGHGHQVWLPALHRRWRVAIWAGVAAFLIGAFSEAGIQAMAVAKAAGESLGAALGQLVATEPARTSLLLKTAVPVALLLLLPRRTPMAPATSAAGIVAPAPGWGGTLGHLSLAALLLLAISVTSHAAATGALLPLLADWLHLLSAAGWVGGLIYLGTVLAPISRRMDAGERVRLMGALVPRFSNLAFASVVVLVATGAYAAWLNIPAWRAIVTTPYGRTLAFKVALIVPLLGIAAVNLLGMRPRLAAAAREATDPAAVPPLHRRFFRLVTAEAVLASAILVAAAVLALLPTARQAQALAPERALTLLRQTESVQGVLRIDRYQVGENTFELRLRNPQSGLPIPDVRVRFTFLPLAASLGAAVADASPQGDGRYVAEGAYIATRGPWLITVTVRGRGVRDVHLLYPVEPDWERGTAITPPTDPQAMALLREADETMNHLRSLRQRQEIADRSGNDALTFFALAAPNFMRYRVVGGDEVILLGEKRFIKSDGWRSEGSPVNFRFPNFSFSQNAGSVVFGPRETVDGVRAQVVTFILNLGGSTARYAVWIDERTRRIVRDAMVARGHYMTTRYYDFNAPVSIRVPGSP